MKDGIYLFIQMGTQQRILVHLDLATVLQNPANVEVLLERHCQNVAARLLADHILAQSQPPMVAGPQQPGGDLPPDL